MTVVEVGKVNGYYCSVCEQTTWTVHVDVGTAPPFIACRATFFCPGQAVSMKYRNVPSSVAPEWEWYKPGSKGLKGFSPEVREHCKKGGLLLRPFQEMA